MTSIKLKLSGLASSKQTFTRSLTTDFFDEVEPVEVRSADVTATVTVAPADTDGCHLVIECRGHLVIPCDRCLADLTHEVDARYEVTVRVQGDVYDDSSDTQLLVPESWQELDLAPLVRDTILLTVPMIHSHPEGQCDSEMTQYLADHRVDDLPGDEAAEDIDPRWAALKQLKDENNIE